MKKLKYLLILGILFAVNGVSAATGISYCPYGEKTAHWIHASNENLIVVESYKETTNVSDEYDTIERNSTIIGATKFTSEQVITAYKASKAGYDLGVLQVSSDNYYSNEGPDYPTVYIYYGEVGGWYALDENNNATSITDSESLAKLNSQNIYSVNNNIKGIFVGNYKANTIDYCINDGIYLMNYNDSTGYADYYVSSFAQNIILNLNSTSKLVYDSTNSKYNIVNYEIEIVDVEASVSGQAKIYIKDSNNNYVSGKATITYTNESSEEVEISSSGYLVPNRNSIEKVDKIVL